MAIFKKAILISIIITGTFGVTLGSSYQYELTNPTLRSYLSSEESLQLDSLVSICQTSHQYGIILETLDKIINSFHPKIGLYYSHLMTKVCNDLIQQSNDKQFISYLYMSYNHSIGLYLMQYQIDSAQKLVDESFNLQQLYPSKKAYAETNGLLACIYRDQGKNIEAIETFNESIKVYRQLGLFREMPDLFNEIASIYLNNSQVDTGLAILTKSLAILDTTGNNRQKMGALNRLANAYMNHGEFDTALETINKSLAIPYNNINPKKIPAEAYFIKGVILKKLKAYNKSNKELNKAMKMLTSLQEYPYLESITACLAKNHLELGDSSKALFYYTKSYSYIDSLPSPHYGFVTLIGLSRFHFSKGDTEKAISYGLECYKSVTAPYYVPGYVSQITELLAKLYNSAGNKDAAVTYYDLHLSAKDSISVNSNIKAIVTTKFKNQLKELNKKYNQKQNQLKKTKAQSHKKTILMGISILFVILFLFLTFYFRNKLFSTKRSSDKVILTLSEENKQIKSEYRKALKNLNNLLNQIKEKNSLSQHNLTANSETNVSQLKENAKVNASWTEFTFQFEQLYKGFLEQLDMNCPNLTSTDIRFCMLFKLNCSTKEMAQIMNITPEGAKKARKRIRAKLGVPQGQSVTEFMKNWV